MIYDIRYTIYALLMVLVVTVSAQVPPVPPVAQPQTMSNATPTFLQIGTNTYKLFTPPSGPAAMTNVLLTWDRYTNYFFVIQASTNLTDWYWKTNIPIWQTNALIPLSQPFEFYRIGCSYMP